MYDLRRSRKPEAMLTDEEIEVRHTLRDYRVTDCTRSFVPTKLLYSFYRRGLLTMTDREPGVVTLGIKHFGAALLRVFPDLEGRRCYRTFHGRRCWGYWGVEGPESTLTYDVPGRPVKP